MIIPENKKINISTLKIRKRSIIKLIDQMNKYKNSSKEIAQKINFFTDELKKIDEQIKDYEK